MSPIHINTHITYRTAPFTPEQDEEEEGEEKGTEYDSKTVRKKKEGEGRKEGGNAQENKRR